ncbi:MAG: M14 family zinc carboxypeptidase [Bacteroidota bacterium]
MKEYSKFLSVGAAFVLLLAESILTPCLSQVPDRGGEKYKNNQTPSYAELLDAYKQLDKESKNAVLVEKGMTDIGKPIPVFYITETGNYKKDLSNEKKVNILVNNGIHPGEPDGIDASLWLAKELTGKNKEWLKKLNVVIIAVYNVDGMLNRGCCSRANQNGPEEYGFRGNAKNLDLNRDFMKMDSKNARTFAKIFHGVKPHVFVDTHVSNGADYQYTMTLITTQPDKLGGSVSSLCQKKMNPALYKKMEERKFPMTPYVNTKLEIPDSGIVAFNESPRFATGYAALFHTIGFTTETHMFKPFRNRVEATHHFLEELLIWCKDNSEEIIVAKMNDDLFASDWSYGKSTGYNFECDTSRFEWISFNGYEAEYPVNELTGKTQLHYNRNKPFTRPVRFYNTFEATRETEIPFAYIIPQGWESVIERLKWNDIKMFPLHKDTVMNCTSTYIISYETSSRPYEGHYLHHSVKTKTVKQDIRFYKGDFVIFMDQPGTRFIIEALEPDAVDSYFNWNFFDAVLQQKEWFSSYVFVEKAKEILDNNPALKAEFDGKKKQDAAFRNDEFAQLMFIYKNSPFYELSHNRIPVFRIEKRNSYLLTRLKDKKK